MATERLYYENQYTRSFSSRVVSCEREGGVWLVTLESTAFYPEGGGQPGDIGTLGAAGVTDTQERDGEVIHLCTAPLEPGSPVSGEIDWPRRFDFMQQHSGEHIVSGLVHARFGYDNVGFHLGKDAVTIDFNGMISPAGLAELETKANAVIWRNAATEITYPDSRQLEELEYRSKKALSGAVRIVSWPGADCCACCGTHVRSSGQVGMVKLISCQKFRDGVRIEMAAGGRALKWANQMAGQNTRVSQLLSAKPGETAAAVERLQKDLYTLRGRVAELEEGDFIRKAEALAGKGDALLVEGPMSGESLRKLCGLVREKCGGRCAVFAGADGSFQYAIGQDGGDLRGLAKALNEQLNGRGGGKPEFVQGSVKASESEIRAFF